MNTTKRKTRVATVPQDMVTGTIHKTSSGECLVVVRYENKTNVGVKFLGYSNEISATSWNIRKGSVKNAMYPSVCGKGFLGVGKYSTSSCGNVYQIWKDMIIRCYDTKCQTKHPTYKECTVAAEWLNFQNFAEWFYKESNFEYGTYLDKDLKVQNNKIYAPQYCQFVSREVNTILINSRASRGLYRLGVSLRKNSSKFVATCCDGKGRNIHLGLFCSEKEAHEAYKVYKYRLIKELACTQKDAKIRKSLLSWAIPEW